MKKKILRLEINENEIETTKDKLEIVQIHLAKLLRKEETIQSELAVNTRTHLVLELADVRTRINTKSQEESQLRIDLEQLFLKKSDLTSSINTIWERVMNPQIEDEGEEILEREEDSHQIFSNNSNYRSKPWLEKARRAFLLNANFDLLCQFYLFNDLIIIVVVLLMI